MVRSTSSFNHQKSVNQLPRLDGKEARVVLQQAADDVDQVKRSLSPTRVDTRFAGSTILSGNQLRHDIRRWLSPPDLSANHNIACTTHHEGTATWFFRGSIYHDWKSSSSEPLLWIYGKRAPLSHSCLTPPDKILNM